jgi:pyruvate carboxylase subunit B
LDFADREVTKSIAYWTKVLEDEELETSEENIFIAASCDQKGIAFLKGEGPLMIRKGKNNQNCGEEEMSGNYTVVVDGKSYSVQVAEGDAEISVAPVAAATTTAAAPVVAATGGKGSIEINSQTPGNVWKILKAAGDSVNEGEQIMILEAMKMEIDIVAEKTGVIKSIEVNTNDAVVDGQLLATME